MKSIVYILGLSVVLFLNSCANKTEITTALLDEMVNREQLSELPTPAYTTKQFSSYGRNSVGHDKSGWFANADRSHPPFPRPPGRPNGCFRSLPLKAVS